jgi:CheY-like chemotaxis protein
MPHTRISDVVVLYPDGSMRALLCMALEGAGYTVTEAPTYAAVLQLLHMAAGPRVVVVGNLTADTQTEEEFFGHLAADAALAQRHRYVLLSTVPEWHPMALDATLCRLGVAVVRVPFHLPDLLATLTKLAALTGERTSTNEDGDEDVATGL